MQLERGRLAGKSGHELLQARGSTLCWGSTATEGEKPSLAERADRASQHGKLFQAGQDIPQLIDLSACEGNFVFGRSEECFRALGCECRALDAMQQVRLQASILPLLA